MLSLYSNPGQILYKKKTVGIGLNYKIKIDGTRPEMHSESSDATHFQNTQSHPDYTSRPSEITFF